MTPASPNFIRLIRLVCEGVDARNEGELLAKLAGEEYLANDELLRRGPVGAGPVRD